MKTHVLIVSRKGIIILTTKIYLRKLICNFALVPTKMPNTEMSTVYKITLKPILTFGKLFGLINFCYTLESTGLLIQYTNTMYLKFLEWIRMMVLLICTYIVYQKEFYYSQKRDLLQFWVAIITARLSEIWTIKYVNNQLNNFKQLKNIIIRAKSI